MIAALAAAVAVALLLGVGIWCHIENQRYGALIATVVDHQARIRTALRANGIHVDDGETTTAVTAPIRTDTRDQAEVLLNHVFEGPVYGKHAAKEGTRP